MTTTHTAAELAANYRNAELADIITLLENQTEAMHDVNVGTGAITIDPTTLALRIDGDSFADSTGVSSGRGHYTLTRHAQDQLAERLGIPAKYLRHLRAEAGQARLASEAMNDPNDAAAWLADEHLVRGLFVDNVEGMLAHVGGTLFVRTFSQPSAIGDDLAAIEPGVARAVLSDRYRRLDNLDVLTATLQGVHDSGASAEIVGCDLSDTSMHVRIAAPQVAVEAAELLRNYSTPFDGHSGPHGSARGDDGTLPVVFAGLVVRNSEVGSGAFSITPRLVVQICSNGMTVKVDALRSVHTGKRLDEGVIEWSDATREHERELIMSQAADAARTFLTEGYVAAQVAKLTEASRTELPPAGAPTIVEAVTKAAKINEADRKAILGHFISSGDLSAAGVGHAVTAQAQCVDDADEADRLESLWLDVSTAAMAAVS